MGREWLYKAAGGGGTAPSTTRHTKTKRERSNSTSSGCMTAFFKLFDIQNHQFRFHHPSFMSQSAINNNPQGVEAPRNSLQSLETIQASKIKEQSNLNIPMGGIQIKTKRSRLTEVDLSSECSSSPGTKTPNLVARLMGLDLLPEYSSPRPSSSSTPATTHHRTRSLPATPRTSTTSRRSMDNNDYHHRLSLQINNKENCNATYISQERRRSELPVNRQDHEERSKQIANQVRERISRRLGTDITNTIRNNEQRRDSNLVLLKPKKQQPAPAPVAKTKRDDPVAFSSTSPKLRLLDINNNLNRPISHSQPKPAKSASFSASVGNTHDQTPLAKKCKKIASERYDLRLKKEVFVNKIISNKKSTPLPNHVVNVTNNTTKFLSFKKEMTSSSSSSSTTRLPQKQVSLVSMTQLPSSSSLNSSSYNSNDTRTLNLFSVKDSNAAATSSSATATATVGRLFSDHSEVLKDIDGLISRDIGRSMRRLLTAEAEEMVREIEGEIVERMVDEVTMAMAMGGWGLSLTFT